MAKLETPVAVEVVEVSRSFGEVVALHDVSLEVPRGQLVALLGPNGAGKSTLVDILCTVSRPDSGEVRLDGRDALADPVAARRRIGVVFQEPTLDTRLTVAENLALHCAAWGVPRRARGDRIRSALSLAGLEGKSDAPAVALSSGLRRRLEIARALLHDPAVLILDEPTVGLDAAARQALWDHVAELRVRQGITILSTTHYISEVEDADQVHIISEGQIVASGSPAALREAHGRTTLRVVPGDAASRDDLMRRLPQAREARGELLVEARDGAEADRLLEECRAVARSVTLERASLEAAFLALTGGAR